MTEKSTFKRARQAMSDISGLSFHPLTPERWVDFERLFGKHGASGGCWCMWWRLKRSEFVKQKGEENRKAMKRIVGSGEILGILGYLNSEPVGWCSVAPREAFPALERSRVLGRIDDAPVWSIVCFYVAKQFRRKGVTTALLKAAIDHVREQGGKIIEGYPIEPKKGQTPDVFAYTGLASAFRKAGFAEVLRRSETRPIMRYVVNRNAKDATRHSRTYE